MSHITHHNCQPDARHTDNPEYQEPPQSTSGHCPIVDTPVTLHFHCPELFVSGCARSEFGVELTTSLESGIFMVALCQCGIQQWNIMSSVTSARGQAEVTQLCKDECPPNWDLTRTPEDS